MPEDSFSVRDIGVVLATMLGIQKNDTVQIQRNKLDPDRVQVLVIRHGQEQKSGS